MVMFCKSVFNLLVSCLTKNEIDNKLQREKLYNSHKTAFLIVGHFAFEFLFDLFIAYIDCRAYHAASFVIFCFYLRKHIRW
jgi:hypothetical protein